MSIIATVSTGTLHSVHPPRVPMGCQGHPNPQCLGGTPLPRDNEKSHTKHSY